MAVVSLRIDLGEERRFGPGKARLLELIRDTGSISAAGRALGMSYRRAWLLTDELNQLLGQRLVEPQHGGAKGGGARITQAGTAVLEAYRRIEAAADVALEKEKKLFRSSRKNG
ncbi:MAG TPA: LysR family transcriptional regulator [Candidatus Binatia bacterium]|nr:LysR family transcriptional regulator [Candidatus Binatia bacterium]